MGGYIRGELPVNDIKRLAMQTRLLWACAGVTWALYGWVFLWALFGTSYQFGRILSVIPSLTNILGGVLALVFMGETIDGLSNKYSKIHQNRYLKLTLSKDVAMYGMFGSI
ncbi:hypothetical protein KIPB_008839, partial [Kipferlia bialata]|eukprot:g8839.t1